MLASRVFSFSICTLLVAGLQAGVSSTAADKTEVYIIGSPHRETSLIKKADLYAAIEKCKPGLLLVECDSGMLGTDFRFSPSLLNVYEFGLADQYIKEHPGVLLRPFDIEGRNNFFAQNHFFEDQGRFFNSLEEMYRKDSLSRENKKIYESLVQFNQQADSQAESALNMLNSSVTDSIVENKMNWYYNNFSGLIAVTPSLTSFKKHFELDSLFWIRRNNRMAEHILSYSRLFPGRTIVVLTGFYHRYIQKKLLNGAEAKKYVRVKEYYNQ